MIWNPTAWSGRSRGRDHDLFETEKRDLIKFTSVTHTDPKPGRYIVAVKVIDIFGNDTMTLVPVTVG